MNKEEKIRRKRKQLILRYSLFTVLVLVGVGIGILLRPYLFPEIPETYKQRRSGGNEYINPLIDFETVESTRIKEILDLEEKLEKYAWDKTLTPQKSKVSHISIYLKDLNSGGWIGVNEEEEFTPASLLKLPLMIAAYKVAESTPGYLERSIVYEKEPSEVEQITMPTQSLEEGKEYTLEELIRRVIIYSDNAALQAIEKLIDYPDVEKVYDDLGVKNPYEYEMIDLMTVKSYASFFRILYNASYLNKDMSTKALKLLSETNYDKGISAGIPNNIQIADKFGEREYTGGFPYENKQLHNCGVIYHPTKPYILCVMTRGGNFEALQNTLKEVSNIVYNTVNN